MKEFKLCQSIEVLLHNNLTFNINVLFMHFHSSAYQSKKGLDFMFALLSRIFLHLFTSWPYPTIGWSEAKLGYFGSLRLNVVHSSLKSHCQKYKRLFYHTFGQWLKLSTRERVLLTCQQFQTIIVPLFTFYHCHVLSAAFSYIFYVFW